MRRLWSRYLRVGGLAVGGVGLTGLVASAGVAAADAPLPPTPAPPVVIPGSPVAVTQLAGTGPTYYVETEQPGTQVGQGSSLVFTIASLGNGSVGIRADDQVIPSGATCISAGGLSAEPAG